MRSYREIIFRLRQEGANLWNLARRSEGGREAGSRTRLDKLPDPESVANALRGSAYAAGVERLAESVMAHRIPLFGGVVDTGPEIHWRRDYVHGRESGLRYFRLMPYLDFARVGDHKVIWELNRHQHLVLLAQAHRLTGRHEFLDETVRQLESWFAQNPFPRGMNWASALEVAFRALSWIWIYHLLADEFPEVTRQHLTTALYRHGLHLESNLSVYFSPNTHLLGEAVALHALGVLFPEFPRATRWKEMGADLVEAQMEKQVRGDGSHFEQSTYYHVYAVDLFLFHALLTDTSAAYRAKLARMAEYLWALLGPEGEIPVLGDDDGGRVFYPYGDRVRFGRATLAACAVFLNRSDWPCEREDAAEIAAWWLGPRALAQSAPWKPRGVSELFSDSGVAVMTDGHTQIVVDTLGFGAGGAGHSHAHALSLVCRRGEREILIDPRTYTYVVDAKWRDRFRGTAAHNTVCVDSANQAETAGPFRWNRKPVTVCREWRSNESFDYLSAACSYSGCTHWRRVFWLKKDLLAVVDVVEGSGERTLEQYWHLGRRATLLTPRHVAVGTDAILCFAGKEGAVEITRGEKSPVYGQKIEAPVARLRVRAALPARLGVLVDFSGGGRRLSVNIDQRGAETWLAVEGMEPIALPRGQNYRPTDESSGNC